MEAAFETLRANGFAATSARRIARTGGFNQALIFYHFGGVNELLLAALDLSSERRLARYSEALISAGDLRQVIDAAARLYREDAETGHTTVLAELFAASLAVPALGVQLTARMEPWIAFTEELMRRFLGRVPLGGLIDVRAAAQTALAMYLGIDLLVHAGGDGARTDSIFEAASRLGEALDSLLEET